LLILGMTGVPAGAQNQTPSTSQNSSSGSSLGDYARQVRKDPGGTSKPKVYDNDNLPREDKLSVVGQTPATTTANAAAQTESTAPAEAAKPSSDSKTETQDKAATAVRDQSATAPTAGDDGANKAAADKQWADKIAAQKDQIDLLGREFDVLQREYQIRAAAMYADVGNRMRNSADWDKQDTQYKQQIADKQKALDDAKQKLEDLQEEARKAGASASARE
jgi:hypothetical protein